MMGWWPHNRDGRHSPEPVDRLPLTLVYSSWDSSQSWIVLALNHMSLVMRRPGFCIFENKNADQLRGNREADQRLCFRYTDSTIPLLSKPEISSLRLAIFSGCTARFVSDLVENPEDRFSHNEAHISLASILWDRGKRNKYKR